MSTAIAPTTTGWKLDPNHTSIEFSAKHMMFTTVKGRFADFEGTISGDSDAPETARVHVTMKTATIDTRNGQRDQHLRSADFLDAATYPDVVFTSTLIEGDARRFRMTGDLTIRGTTRPVTFDVTYEGAGKDPWGGERIGFSAAGKIDRRDFGLVWNQALETGGVLVSNDVKIQIDARIIREG
jgi:polyisoprenoid-binding protein YceI